MMMFIRRMRDVIRRMVSVLFSEPVWITVAMTMMMML